MAEKSMKLTNKPIKLTPLVPEDMLFILDSEDSDSIKRVAQTLFKGEKGDDGAPGPGISVKGSVDTVGELPIGAEAGDAYVVRENRDLYISDGADNWAVADITGFVYKGTWDGATEYEPDDVVTYDGSAYFCILGGNMGELPDDPGSVYWTLFLSKGADGVTGNDGNTVLSGVVAPDPGLGELGDFYIDTVLSQIYGPKTGAGWGSATDLVGPTGPAPVLTYRGEFLGPSSYSVNDVVTYNGTSYVSLIEPNSYNLPRPYQINGGAWAPLAVGTKWTGAFDSGSSYFENMLVSHLGVVYICNAVALYPPVTEPQNDPARWAVYLPAGEAGTDGADGRTILNGSGAPGPGVGEDGDFYLDTTLSQLYGPKDPATGWGVPIDLVGADGEDGASSYTAIAYADDDSGTGFTMTFDPDKDYIAIKTSTSPIPETPAQFAGLWKYYAGGAAPAVETAPEGLYTCDTGGSYEIHLVSSDTEYSLPLTEVIGDGLALGEHDDSIVVDYDKAAFYRCLHNICGNIKPDNPCTLTLKLYQDDVLQRYRTLKVFEYGADFTSVLMVLNYITEGVTGGTKIMLTLSADIDEVWAAVEGLNHNMTFRQYTPNPEDELPEGAFLDEEGGAFIDEEGSFFIDGE